VDGDVDRNAPFHYIKYIGEYGSNNDITTGVAIPLAICEYLIPSAFRIHAVGVGF